jgi:hypothetical protein
MQPRHASSERTVASVTRALSDRAKAAATSERATQVPNAASTVDGGHAKAASTPHPRPATGRTTTATARQTMGAPEPRAAPRPAHWQPDAAEAVVSSTPVPTAFSIATPSSRTVVSRSWVRQRPVLRAETCADGRVRRIGATTQRRWLRGIGSAQFFARTAPLPPGVKTDSVSWQTAPAVRNSFRLQHPSRTSNRLPPGPNTRAQSSPAKLGAGETTALEQSEMEHWRHAQPRHVCSRTFSRSPPEREARARSKPAKRGAGVQSPVSGTRSATEAPVLREAWPSGQTTPAL